MSLVQWSQRESASKVLEGVTHSGLEVKRLFRTLNWCMYTRIIHIKKEVVIRGGKICRHHREEACGEKDKGYSKIN